MFNIDMFAEVLNEQIDQQKLSLKTKTYYLANLKKLENLCRNDIPSATELERVITFLCNNTKQTAKFVAAVKKYERDILGSPQILLYGEPLARLRSKGESLTGGKEIVLQEKTYEKKINRMENEKLKLAFRLQKKSGLRIGEIAELLPADVAFDESDKIILSVRNGKGRKNRTVTTIDDSYLKEHLQTYMKRLEGDGTLFQYTESFLIKKAGEYGMQTHDLRRINARERFRIERKTGCGKRSARREVSKQLGHSHGKTTNLYLGKEWVDKPEDKEDLDG